MDNETIGFIGLASLFLLIGLRIPIGVALIGVSFSGIWALIGFSGAVSSLKIVPYTFAANWQLSSVPMFLFMGFFCYHSGITKGLFDAARVWLSRLPGSLAIASVFGASGFAAVTGSSLACSAAMGRIAVPEMVRFKYSPALATGTVAAGGTIGALIPPSILFIMFGILTQQPIGKLFLAGASAGLLTAVAYIVVILIWSIARPEAAPKSHESFTLRERLRALVAILPVIVLALTVFGGLFGGIFTPTEAGAVGSGIAILISFVTGSFTWRGFRDSVVESFSATSTLLVIAIGANLLSRFVALSGAGDAVAEFAVQAAANPALLLMVIALVYLALGMFLDPMGAMLLTLPVLLPIAIASDFNLIWFGVIVAKLLEIGMITPPVGLNVFIIKSVVGDAISLTTIFRGVTVFILADLVVVIILMSFPEFVLFLPNLLD